MDALYYASPIIMPFDGVNGSTVFTNYGTSAKNTFYIQQGAPVLSSAQNKFGGTSCYFDGASQLRAAKNALPAMPGDFTLEGWVYPTALPSWYATLASMDSSAFGLYLHNGALVWYTASGDHCASSPLTANVWTHFAVTRSNGIIQTFVNGVASASSFADSTSYTMLDIGGHNTDYLTGYIDDFHVTNGFARYTADFTPPVALDIENLPVTVRATASPFALLQLGGVPAPACKATPTPVLTRDMVFGGTGRISGTTKAKGTPDYAVRRRVRLYAENTGLLVREQWSDAASGAYSFDRISTDYKYTVLSYDYEHNFRAVIADNLTPDPMP